MSTVVADLGADPITQRLEDQIAWYDRKSHKNMIWYKSIKIMEIVSAAVIPLLGALKLQYSAIATALLGVLITVFEGMLHLNQFHENWVRFRATCESLKHEKFTFLANATPYAGVEKPRALLAERVESLVSQECTKWESVQQQQETPRKSA